jgi:hypothetical protein
MWITTIERLASGREFFKGMTAEQGATGLGETWGDGTPGKGLGSIACYIRQ